jgi:glycolate oxidase FAD binding subunit
VKNVAGYDLSKLVTGSFGSLAAIVSATFKLAPLPAASKTMRIGAGDAAALADMVRTVMASQLEPVAFELVSRRSTRNAQNPQSNSVSASSASSALYVVIRFASLPTVVDAQIVQATDTLRPYATHVEVVDGDAERALWHGLGTEIWDQPGAIVRASWLPANIADGLGELDRITAGLEACVASLQGRAAIGAGLIRIDGDTPAQAAVIERLRGSSLFGNVVVLRGSDALKTVVDVWGSHGDRQPLFDSLKHAFDPTGVLNAGRGPV